MKILIQKIIYDPMSLYRFFLELLKSIKIKLRISYFGPYNIRYYPKEIREISLRFKSDINLNQYHQDKWDIFNFNSGSNNESIYLAGTKVSDSEIMDLWENKNSSEYDDETVNLAYRFHWLLEKLASDCSYSQLKIFYKMIVECQKKITYRKNCVSLSPYNISERICNLVVFASIAYKHSCIDNEEFQNIRLIIKNDLLCLKENLEYPASGIINNHIVNNARALYIGGCFLNLQDSIHLSKAILKKHLPEMIGKGGFLKEASSHYQLLLTKNILEVSIIAEQFNDQEFYEWISSLSRKMVYASEKLIPKQLKSLRNFPTIGDISPDIPLGWFDPREHNNEGLWNKLWKQSSTTYNRKESYEENNGWYSVNEKNWFVLAYSHPSRKEYPAGHGHRDFGSFILYDNGTPMIIDIGRYTYNKSKSLTPIGNEATSHSSVILNQREPLYSGERLKKIFKTNPNFKKHFNMSQNNSNSSADWKSQFFWEVIEHDYQWSRALKVVNDKKIVISDSYNALEIEGFLYFSKYIKILSKKKNSLILELNDKFNFLLTINGIDHYEIENTDYFPSYGLRSKTKRLRWNKKNPRLEEDNINISIIKVRK